MHEEDIITVTIMGRPRPAMILDVVDGRTLCVLVQGYQGKDDYECLVDSRTGAFKAFVEQARCDHRDCMVD